MMQSKKGQEMEKLPHSSFFWYEFSQYALEEKGKEKNKFSHDPCLF